MRCSYAGSFLSKLFENLIILAIILIEYSTAVHKQQETGKVAV